MSTIIRNAIIINENTRTEGDIFIKNGIIEKISDGIYNSQATTEIDAKGKWLLPGIIDDQVHFREPGLTHKGNIYSESRAAVAGGITSFMEMPNTNPPATTQALLEDKYNIASQNSPANYSFYIGATNDNLAEVLRTNGKEVCGIKVFMGSSTGNMLVDNRDTLEKLFAEAHLLIATHCEDEATIRQNLAAAKAKYGENIPLELHPEIRSAEACYLSSSMAIELAKEHNTRLHILHISTERELALFDNTIPLAQKRITAEACVHHLWFSEKDYAHKGNLIKWNPAIKAESDRKAIIAAINNNRIDVIATDHAPHTLEEKANPYLSCPSGGPLAQHSLVAMLTLAAQGEITVEKLVEKMCHNPAIMFDINRRGYLREGYYADMVLINQKQGHKVKRENVISQCGWSPMEGYDMAATIESTFVNGNMVYNNGKIIEGHNGMRLKFRGE